MIRDIAQRVVGLSLDDLTPLARERLELCLLANLSVGLAGVPYCRLPCPEAPGGRYPLLSGAGASDPRAAAFYNAAVMHARTQDDFDPIGNLHAGTVIIPAVLAVAEDTELSGKKFLEAIAAGYMVAIGISRFLSPKTTPRGIRSTGYYAPFGATAAVAKARGLDATLTGHALALTTVFAGGTTQAWLDGSDEWQLHVANAAETGIKAVDLALAGVLGGEHALDGPAGFHTSLLGERVSFDMIAADFDPSRALEESVIKRYPVSGICQSLVLAAERVRKKIADPAAITRIRVEMNPFEMGYPGTLNRGPAFHAFGERLMSAPFCAAAVIARGALQFPDFHGAADSVRDTLLPIVDVVADPERPMLSARILVTMQDGRVETGETRDSRAEVRLDWTTITDWGQTLWKEGGRDGDAFETCAQAIRALHDSPSVDLRFWRTG